MRIIFLGNKQAGMVGLLTAIAWGVDVVAVVTKSVMVEQVADSLLLPVFESYQAVPMVDEIDLMISVHSREILPIEFLEKARMGGINVHPCLYKYKGTRPVPRMLEDGITKASVGVHWMTDKVDEGKVILEKFMEVKSGSPEEVYNQMYSLYATTLLEALYTI